MPSRPCCSRLVGGNATQTAAAGRRWEDTQALHAVDAGRRSRKMAIGLPGHPFGCSSCTVLSLSNQRSRSAVCRQQGVGNSTTSMSHKSTSKHTSLTSQRFFGLGRGFPPIEFVCNPPRGFDFRRRHVLALLADVHETQSKLAPWMGWHETADASWCGWRGGLLPSRASLPLIHLPLP